MADLERTYNIPLRKEFQKAPKYKRAKKAITAVREFLVKHMKSDNILIGPKLNEAVWEKGIKNPPHHIKVTVVKNTEGEVRAELFGFEFKKKEAAKKRKKKAGGLLGKLKDTIEEGKEEKEKLKEAKEKKLEKIEEKKEDLKKEIAERKEEPKKEEKPAEKQPEPKEEKPAEPAK